jgi:hypothetical protein
VEATAVRAGDGLDLTANRSSQASRERETQPRPIVIWGAICTPDAGLEDPLEIIRGDTPAIVSDHELDRIAVRVHADLDQAVAVAASVFDQGHQDALGGIGVDVNPNRGRG